MMHNEGGSFAKYDDAKSITRTNIIPAKEQCRIYVACYTHTEAEKKVSGQNGSSREMGEPDHIHTKGRKAMTEEREAPRSHQNQTNNGCEDHNPSPVTLNQNPTCQCSKTTSDTANAIEALDKKLEQLRLKFDRATQEETENEKIRAEQQKKLEKERKKTNE